MNDAVQLNGWGYALLLATGVVGFLVGRAWEQRRRRRRLPSGSMLVLSPSRPVGFNCQVWPLLLALDPSWTLPLLGGVLLFAIAGGVLWLSVVGELQRMKDKIRSQKPEVRSQNAPVPRHVKCDGCQGKGGWHCPIEGWDACPKCWGTGWMDSREDEMP